MMRVLTFDLPADLDWISDYVRAAMTSRTTMRSPGWLKADVEADPVISYDAVP
jgi:hypothetical protein